MYRELSPLYSDTRLVTNVYTPAFGIIWANSASQAQAIIAQDISHPLTAQQMLVLSILLAKQVSDVATGYIHILESFEKSSVRVISEG